MHSRVGVLDASVGGILRSTDIVVYLLYIEAEAAHLIDMSGGKSN